MKRGSHYALSLLALALALALALVAAPAPAQEGSAPSPADSARPGMNRLFFVPTGRTYPAGVWEAGTYYLIAPYLGYAPHDRFMVSVGTPIIPEVFGRWWYLTPKVGVIASSRWNVAAGALVLLDLGEDPLSGSNQAEPFLWGVVTYGGHTASLTAGIATDAGQLDVLPDGGMVLVGAEWRLPTRVVDRDDVSLRLIAEGYLDFPGGDRVRSQSLAIVGVRFRAGHAAFEIVYGLEISGGSIDAWPTVPLFNVSTFF